MTQLNGKSKDLLNENIEKLKEIFPEVFSEGKIDFSKLEEELGNFKEKSDERYNFTWSGKSEAKKIALTPSTGTLRPCKDESKDWDTTGNLYIEGDNLEVLKLLQKSYHKKIKMIYIDPPYNTGKDFVYKDNFKDNIKNYLEVTGQVDSEGNKLSTNTETNGRYHSDWLNMMYPRLKLARNLLKDDGVMFISIDDNEVTNLRKLCEEIFGEENVESYIWYLNDSSEGSFVKTPSKTVRNEHETIIACFKSNKYKELGKYLDYRYKDRTDFTNPDNDPRGNWMSGNISRNGIKSTTGSKYFVITTPTGVEYARNWTISKSEYEELVADNRLYFSNNGDGVPRLKIFQNEPQENTQSSLFQNLKSSSTGKKEVSEVFDGNEIFQFPKPTALIKRLLMISNTKNEMILDFFSGSGTTGHAVMSLNGEDQGNRKFICVQLPEDTETDSLAYQIGYKNICEIGKKRIIDSGAKIDNIDNGLKIFKLDSSNIKLWDSNFDNLERTLVDMVDNIKSDRSEEDIVYEILLKYGLDLTLPIETLTINDKKVYSIGFGSLVCCLDNNINTDTIEKIAELKTKYEKDYGLETMRVVFKDNSFKDSIIKTNAIQILNQFGIKEIISI
ncbi:site-specific DNA-methyltransferase [Aliarcobacter cryaerophilus]|uniref:site-specific DNA-methyltransferase n=1 Tax=Aliarcobacter cryaerophilus TaxID=28198 RepID=UPI003DA5FC90